MDNLYEQIEYRGFNINVHYDTEPFNPREDFEPAGHMVCFHGRYDLGDKHDLTQEGLKDIVDNPDNVSLPLYLYDHSGVTMSCGPFSCPWDSGQVGYIYMTKEEIAKESWTEEQAIKYMQGEVEMYDQFLTGQVYGYTIEPTERNKSIECEDSCWGFFGETDYMVTEAEGAINYAIKEYKQEVIKTHKRGGKNER